ncbi:MAG TPA: hypothetical protein VJR29_01405 [bacterium]|nr:hypothetical protein [bacterium]
MSRGIFTWAVAGFLAASSPLFASQNSLLDGAFTDVPPSAQPEGYFSVVDGGPLHVLSGLTAVEFHVPGKISSEPGGLSPIPHPVLREDNGVKYWFISGELSGYYTDEFGQHVVVGPVDLNGVSHRLETFDPDDPGVEDPVSHPRAGKPGAFFALSIPAKGFNGGLIQIEPAGDGGTFFPAASLLWNPVDPIVLLQRGYAVFNFAQGGTVMANAEGTIDTNPESGSGIFWGDPENVVSYARFSFFDEATGRETTLPSDFSLTFEDGGTQTIPFGDPEFFVGSIHFYGEIISDTIVFAKNLVRQLLSEEVEWTSYVGWSGSVRAATLINSNTRFGPFQVAKSVGPPAGGSAYNVYGDPSSGLRYDAFVCYAGINDSQGYLDQGLFTNVPSDVNPALPASAPFVWFVPELDTGVPQYSAYAYANKIWKALEKLGDASKINDLVRIYSLPKSGHTPRDFNMASFDKNRRDGLWFEFLDTPEFGAFNEKGKGFRVSDSQARFLQGKDFDTFLKLDVHGTAALPRHTPLWLQTFANLRLFQEQGIPLPTSRVDPRIYENIDAVSTDTLIPPYPTIVLAFPENVEDFFAAVFTLSHGVEEDTGLQVVFPEEEPSFYNLEELEVEEYKAFADNPLERSTQPILLPDVAAPTAAPGLYVFDNYFARALSAEEFQARYGNRHGYAAAFSAATFNLIVDRLWEPELGMDQIREALAFKP